MMSQFKIASLMLLVCTLAACNLSQKEPLTLSEKLQRQNYVLGAPVDRVQNYHLNGWSYVDDTHVIMRASVRDHYLISLRFACPDLSTVSSIAFSTTVGSLTRHDHLLIKSPGSMLERCPVAAIHKLEPIPKA